MHHSASVTASEGLTDDDLRELAAKGNWINYFCDECGKQHEKNKHHKHHGSADYTGWTPQNGSDANGYGKDGVWVGKVFENNYGDGKDWLVHFKDGGAIDTQAFATEDEALSFAQSHFVTASKKTYCPCGSCGKPCEVVGKIASRYECDECRGR
jgi:hypothetical protein